MFFPPILAHGALGWADEIIFVSVIVIFFGMMGVSWLRSRGIEDREDPITNTALQQPNTQGEDRFELD